MMKNSGGMSFEGMAPEDIFAMGIQKGLALVKDAGRDGDTEIVHVNEQEKQALKDMGGRGSVNPATGLHEYPPAGADIEGSGRGRDPTGGNRDRDDAMARSAASRTRETRDISGQEAQAGGGTATNPTSAGATPGPVGEADTRSLGERLAAGLEAAFSGPSFGPPTGSDPGFLGGLAGLAPGIGPMMAGVRGLQAMGFPGEEKEPGALGDADRDQRDDGILSPGRKPQQGAPAAPQAPQYAWTRPGAAPTAPGGLGLDAGMTPIQQRTALATGGTSGNAGIYRDPAVVEFYRNLALYDLTQPGGAPNPNANVTDIERQFVQQLGGQPGQDVNSFLAALGRL